jgi:hypothetical protein
LRVAPRRSLCKESIFMFRSTQASAATRVPGKGQSAMRGYFVPQ